MNSQNCYSFTLNPITIVCVCTQTFTHTQVSLYQILARKEEQRASSNDDKVKEEQEQEREGSIEADFPLRLLDIRRIDLHSSGWETFYVKRAVEDWIKDAQTNLGE